MKVLLFLLLFVVLISASSILLFYSSTPPNPKLAVKQIERTKQVFNSNTTFINLRRKASTAKIFAQEKGFSTHIAFLLNMRLPSGRKRFFIYDLQRDSIIASGLVAHGSCNKRFLEAAEFSNEIGCGCSAVGRYKVGEAYTGRFGKSFKLYGLDSSNANAYERNIVLHPYSCVPDDECYPAPVCNSLGCTMVSYKFLATAANFIEKEKKPVLLWLYE